MRDRQGGKITRDGKQTVLEMLAQTRADITHVAAMADLIEEGLAALRAQPDASFAFNRSARKPGSTDINFHVDPPQAENANKYPHKHIGTYISIDHKRIYLLEHGATFEGGASFPSTAEGAAEVLRKTTRNAVLYNQIPKNAP